MNDYKVLEISGSGELTANITAIDEKDARRIFRERYKGNGQREITVTLIRENTPATKAQEREALEKIKAIVATLGPRSYVGTALDGCLEAAEDAMIAYGLSIAPAGIRDTLERGVKENYTIRLKVIDAVFRLDVSSVQGKGVTA